MKRSLVAVFVAVFSLALLAAPPLFVSPTRSQWNVATGGKTIGTVKLFTDGRSTHAEWSADGSSATFVGTNEKIWVRATGGDIELASYNKGGDEKIVLPSLLLPITVTPSDSVTTANGKVFTYSYKSPTAVTARYTFDANGVSAVSITAGTKNWTLTRTTVEKTKTSDEELYTVNPKKGATSQLGKMAGGLFGKSDTSVSATAGPRGAGTAGLKLNDGGDYAAVEKLEKRDEAFRKKDLAKELEDFQKKGAVGPSR